MTAKEEMIRQENQASLQRMLDAVKVIAELGAVYQLNPDCITPAQVREEALRHASIANAHKEMVAVLEEVGATLHCMALRGAHTYTHAELNDLLDRLSAKCWRPLAVLRRAATPQSAPSEPSEHTFHAREGV